MVYLSLYGTPRRESAISDHNSPLNVALTRSFPPPSLFLLLFPPASLLPFILSFFFPASPSLCLTTKKPLFPRSFFSRRLFMIRRGKHFPYIMEQTYMNSSWGRRRRRIKRRRSTATQGRGPFLRPCHQLTHRFAGVTYVCAHASSARTISRRMYFHRRFLPSLFLNLHRYCHYQFSKQCNPILSSPSCFFRLIFHVSYFPRSRREEREREREGRNDT